MTSVTSVVIYSVNDLVGYSSNPIDNWGNGQAFDLSTGSITTGATLNPIVIEITDTGVDNATDDQFLTIINSQAPGSAFDEAPTLPTVTNGPAALLGQDVFLTSTAAPGAANHLTAPDQNGNTIEIYEIEINGQLYIVATGPLVPNFTYDEGAFGFGDFGSQSATYSQLFVCFVLGTKIRTALGQKRVEDLQIGDLVWTHDNGLQPVRWIGSSLHNRAALEDNPNLRPIRIKEGSISAGMPAEDLCVSQQHRMLVRSKIVEKMFDEPEVFVPAKKLLAVVGFDVEAPTDDVKYFHVYFDEHQIVEANGVLTESLLPGREALKILGETACQQLTVISPDLLNEDFVAKPARMIAKGKRVQKLVDRHIKNGVPLQPARTVLDARSESTSSEMTPDQGSKARIPSTCAHTSDTRPGGPSPAAFRTVRGGQVADQGSPDQKRPNVVHVSAFGTGGKAAR